jgi:hypothetical protein
MKTDELRMAARPVPSRAGQSPGHGLAVIACVLLLADSLVLIYAGAEFFGLLRRPDILAVSGAATLPVALYFAWALAVAGSVAALVATVLYQYRERWFWRCLVAAAVIWLAFPPVLSVLGLISLVVLIHSHPAFQGQREAADDAVFGNHGFHRGGG